MNIYRKSDRKWPISSANDERHLVEGQIWIYQLSNVIVEKSPCFLGSSLLLLRWSYLWLLNRYQILSNYDLWILFISFLSGKSHVFLMFDGEIHENPIYFFGVTDRSLAQLKSISPRLRWSEQRSRGPGVAGFWKWWRRKGGLLRWNNNKWMFGVPPFMATMKVKNGFQ